MRFQYACICMHVLCYDGILIPNMNILNYYEFFPIFFQFISTFLFFPANWKKSYQNPRYFWNKINNKFVYRKDVMIRIQINRPTNFYNISKHQKKLNVVSTHLGLENVTLGIRSRLQHLIFCLNFIFLN